ncbi:MAG: 2-oxoglutarate dehydrogenase E1 component [Phycisphaerae bacterium]|nr:2-oxoglutarate dehydrogenase E1 component [Phycisphaerae bacterium]
MELGGGNLAFLEALYADYLRDRESVPADYRDYFDHLDGQKKSPMRLGPSFQPRSIFNPDGAGAQPGAVVPQADLVRQHCVDKLVRNYRVRGHIIAQTNPLGAMPATAVLSQACLAREGMAGPPSKTAGRRSSHGTQQTMGDGTSSLAQPRPPELDLKACGLDESDFDRVFAVELAWRIEMLPLRSILQRMENTYCRSIGVQFMHIDDLAERRWLIERMEPSENRLALGRDEQLRIYTRLTDAVMFEEFVRTKYAGAKSFSLEGAETLIPLLDLALERCGEQGVDEVVLGMAHRGRLNVLANIVGKRPRDIFREFDDVDPELYLHGGDVKYHQGCSGDWTTAGGGKKVHLSLSFNPSHIEQGDPVVIGRVRAKQDRAGDAARARKMAIEIHGDAGFIGEGMVQETLNLSGLPGYCTGGTLHVIVNNQIGFTTPPEQGRSATYATDIARMLQSPIFHVNGEDPEAVAQVVRLAMDFRAAFHRDVIIEMVCYRRHGHSESDEPRFTQPTLYRLIDNHRSVREGYLEKLLAMGQLSADEGERIAAERRARLEKELGEATSKDYRLWWPNWETSIWKSYLGGPEKPEYEVETGVEKAKLAALLEKMAATPEGFHPHRTIERFLAARREMAAGKRPVDWSAAEALAVATLATTGHRVRLSGQDSERGTFSQRHGVLHDTEDGRTYVPLASLSADQAAVEIVNSPLSEAGVLGFEYGYSLDCPEGLVIWEAQFGDFVNAAQVIIDQFIVSAQDKWCRLSGLTLFLPHGLEGMGPEHSSGRLERFLTLAADDNIQVLYPTTPAQFFHALRRQVLRAWRKPMVVMTPKSLLRSPVAVSPLADLASGRFRRVIGDGVEAGRVRKILLCSGKVFYELDERRRQLKRDDLAIVRVEQLYPLPTAELEAALTGYADGTPAVWVQEEPRNMGAWSFIWTHYGPTLLGRWPLSVVSPPAMTSPASGSAASHKLGQGRLLAEAMP